MTSERPRALLTVDLEDYRSIRMRDYGQTCAAFVSAELEKQIHLLLALFESLGASATFFCVGSLAGQLPASLWREITDRHPIGGHSFNHERVWGMGPRLFGQDVERTKMALEDISGRAVISYRAPYFSASGCDPWFGELLARTGISIDSSQRLVHAPPGFDGIFPLSGSDGAVTEVPLAALGLGTRQLTIIGGTSFRLLPLPVVRALLAERTRRGFVPMIYLHPYDIDPDARPLTCEGATSYTAVLLGDSMRRAGRRSATEKIRALADSYDFMPIESMFESPRIAE